MGTLLTLLISTSDVRLWHRAPGAYGTDSAPGPAFAETVPVGPLSTVERYDVQYGAKATYRGVALDAVLTQHPPLQVEDTALLHFANGMVVPVPLSADLKKHVFIAVERREGDVFTTTFPPLRKEDSYYVDNRPLTFSTNKLVVDTPAHPMVPAKGKAVFSPWMHVDSLVGIELVQGEAYLAQFDVDASAAAGYGRFRQRCQFCHGARRVGASYGWDYVTPIALYEYRSPRSLFFHVKYRESDAPEKGLMMPALSDFSEKDANDLWLFLRALAQTPLRAYKPLTSP